MNQTQTQNSKLKSKETSSQKEFELLTFPFPNNGKYNAISKNFEISRLSTSSSLSNSPDKDKEIALSSSKKVQTQPEKIEMTPSQLEAFKKEGMRVIIGGVLIHLVHIPEFKAVLFKLI